MKRYNKNTIGFMLGGLLCLSVSACVSDPLDDEQYTKKLTLIGAQEELQEKEEDRVRSGRVVTLPPHNSITSLILPL